MSKDKPELYELLKINRSKLNNISELPKEEKPAGAAPATSSNSEPIPYAAPQASSGTTYPKLKIPFPTLKPKESIIRASRPKTAGPKTLKLPLNGNYQRLAIIGAVLALIAIVVYLAWTQDKPSQPSQPPQPEATTAETGAVKTSPAATQTPAATSARKWSLRLIYYTNNAENQHSVQKILEFLNEKNITDVFTRNETINGAPCTSIYKGRYYASPEEARKDLPQLKKLHYAFKNADAVEVK